MSKSLFHAAIHWTHPKWGPQLEKLSAEGTSIRRALNAMLTDFFRKPELRSLRNAAHAQLELRVWRVKKWKGAKR